MSSISVFTEIVLSGQQDATGQLLVAATDDNTTHGAVGSDTSGRHHVKISFLPSEDEILI